MPAKRKKRKGLYPWAVNDRHHAARQVLIGMGPASRLLAMDVDFGLAFAQSDLDARLETRPSITSLTMLMLFHRAIEHLDAVDCLIQNGAILPAQAQARTALEAIVTMMYLGKRNDERVAGALWLVKELHVVDVYESAAAGHAPGSGPTIKAKEVRASHRARIGEDRIWNEALREMERLRAEEGVGAQWFRAFGGPRTLGGLVMRLEEPTVTNLFNEVYDLWSETVHATDVMESMTDAAGPEDVELLLRPLRALRRSMATHIISTCHTLFTVSVLTLVKYFGEHPAGLQQWLDETQRRYDELIREAEGPD